MSEHEKVKRPASQYYWGDWFRDLALQSCSQPARGLWHEMNCLMHQGIPYGHLTMPNGKPMGPEQLANLCKISPATCRKLLAELDSNGVSSIAESGAVYSRRMVRDEAARQEAAAIGRANGAKGAEHGAKGAEHGKKGGRPPVNNPPPEPPQSEPPQNPPSSTASASSPSVVSEPSVPPAPQPPSAAGALDRETVREAEFWQADAGQASSPPPKPARKRLAREQSGEQDAPTNAIWRAYAQAYHEVYDVEPVRNPKVNGQLAHLLTRLGKDEAPHVADFYVRDPQYRTKSHPVDLLLRDAEGLRTRWARSRNGRSDLSVQQHRRPMSRAEEVVATHLPGIAASNAPRRQSFANFDQEPTDAVPKLSRS